MRRGPTRSVLPATRRLSLAAALISGLLPASTGAQATAAAHFHHVHLNVVDHLAFSYRDIGPVFERMKGAGVEIARPIALDEETGITSFFVWAPDRLLIEVVQERPIPEGVWD